MNRQFWGTNSRITKSIEINKRQNAPAIGEMWFSERNQRMETANKRNNGNLYTGNSQEILRVVKAGMESESERKNETNNVLDVSNCKWDAANHKLDINSQKNSTEIRQVQVQDGPAKMVLEVLGLFKY